MSLYTALCSIWSYRENRGYPPGEKLALDDANARALFKKDAIRPAEWSLPKSIETGVTYDGTNDE